MDISGILQKCRTCGVDIMDLTCGIPIFGHNGKGIQLDQKIQKYLYVIVKPDDELPKSICATCFIKIESIDKFCYAAIKTEENFLTWLRKSKLAASEEDYLTQTIVETSTNSDFSFSNITIKKEIMQNEQQHKIVYRTFRNPRNPRYVDHITLEQIINEQIIKNPKMSPTTIIVEDHPPRKKKRLSQIMPSPDSTATSNEPKQDFSSISYGDVLLGQLIKDQELLKLMLKALKWAEYDKKASYEELLERLKRTNSREILTNKNLLNDNDVMLLLKSYVGNIPNLYNAQQPTPSSTKQNLVSLQTAVKTQIVQTTNSSIAGQVNKPKTINRPRIKYVERNLNLVNDNPVTNMEVRLDPTLFLPYQNRTQNPRKSVSTSTEKIEEIVIDDDDDDNDDNDDGGDGDDVNEPTRAKKESLNKTTDLNKNSIAVQENFTQQQIVEKSNTLAKNKFIKLLKVPSSSNTISPTSKPQYVSLGTIKIPVSSIVQAKKNETISEKETIAYQEESKSSTTEVEKQEQTDEIEIKAENIEESTAIFATTAPESENEKENELKSDVKSKETNKSKGSVSENQNSITNEHQIDSVNEIRNNGKYICSTCPEKFSSNTDLQNHVTSHLINKQAISEAARQSEKCSKVENDLKEKSVEIEKKSEESSSAPKERELIRSKRLQEKRLKKEGSQPKRRSLPIRIKFKSQNEIKRSQKKVCPICNRKVPSENMKAHLIAHNKCNKCGKLFRNVENLKRHKSNNCAIQKTYKCGGCDKEFTNARNRNSHQKKSHPGIEDTEMASTETQ